MYTFNIVFRPEPEGGFTAFVPSLPGCVSYGESLEEAKEMIREAMDLYLETEEKYEDGVVVSSSLRKELDDSWDDYKQNGGYSFEDVMKLSRDKA